MDSGTVPPHVLRIALVHGLPISIAPVERAFERLWPQARISNLLDDGLVPALEEEGGFTPKFNRRILDLCRYCISAGADGILFTGSAFGPAIDEARAGVAVPVLKPYEGMVEDALSAGSRFGVVATYQLTLDLLCADLREAGIARGKRVILETRLASGALDALRRGDQEMHDNLVLTAARGLSDMDATLLAQFSMARVANRLSSSVSNPVFIAPDSAVREMKRRTERRV